MDEDRPGCLERFHVGHTMMMMGQLMMMMMGQLTMMMMMMVVVQGE